MITAELQGKVGVAPSTTTIQLGTTTMTYEEYLATDIELRRQVLAQAKKSEFWNRLGTFATASVTTLALVAAIGAWFRTGKIEAIRK